MFQHNGEVEGHHYEHNERQEWAEGNLFLGLVGYKEEEGEAEGEGNGSEVALKIVYKKFPSSTH